MPMAARVLPPLTSLPLSRGAPMMRPSSLLFTQEEFTRILPFWSQTWTLMSCTSCLRFLSETRVGVFSSRLETHLVTLCFCLILERAVKFCFFILFFLIYKKSFHPLDSSCSAIFSLFRYSIVPPFFCRVHPNCPFPVLSFSPFVVCNPSGRAATTCHPQGPLLTFTLFPRMISFFFSGSIFVFSPSFRIPGFFLRPLFVFDKIKRHPPFRGRDEYPPELTLQAPTEDVVSQSPFFLKSFFFRLECPYLVFLDKTLVSSY